MKIATPHQEQPPAPEQVAGAPAQQQEAAEHQRVAVDHPLQVAAEKPRSAWIDGSATFTTVASRITMNCARQTMTRTSQRLVSPDGGGSTNSSGRSESDGGHADLRKERELGTADLGTIRRERTNGADGLRFIASPIARYFAAHCGCGEIGIHARSGARGLYARGGSSPLSRIVSQVRCYPARRFLPLSSRGLGRRPLTAETGVRIPVAVPHESPASAGLFRWCRRSGGRRSRIGGVDLSLP